MATKLQLKKSEEFLQSADSGRIKNLTSIGAQYRFPKGHQPANKGKKMPGFAPGRMAETQYAKGNVPPNYLPLGSERYSKEGYLQRKMTDTGYPPKDWVPVHWLLWIQHNGPIPSGHRVCFKDRNKKNIVIENLELLSVAEMMKRNSRHNYPAEINEVIYARASLTRHINKRLKNERTENDK
ncbi:HNH endonuclease [Herminiimonas contaminans]|uniref:HNH endonuclease n=2 Tax=Herminiimonas contaminans TaxID=1111140 RepID=A0ABS0EQ20_9BURK|nr:HNH endonuclease [Herminiimonas contaminans]